MIIRSTELNTSLIELSAMKKHIKQDRLQSVKAGFIKTVNTESLTLGLYYKFARETPLNFQSHLLISMVSLSG